jgi:annexin A7/11
MVGKLEGQKIAEILVTRPDTHLVGVVHVFAETYQGKTLEEMLHKKFRGHMGSALLYIIRGAMDRAVRDAKLLEGTMKGLGTHFPPPTRSQRLTKQTGTKDEELNYRLAILHWDKDHLHAVKEAYKLEYPKRNSLVARVKDDTSGDQRRFLVALLED